ncbi:MAG: hypothetical protein Q4B54_10290 [Coriobacteriales bacterium]|nr:hypothetical protein [Coriobacteriales bacterium]
MALENVAKFEELLRTDEATKAKIDELFSAWEGDKADDEAAFEAVVAQVATEAGLPFTYEELKECASDKDVDDEQLEAVAGGAIGVTMGFISSLDNDDQPEGSSHFRL